MITAAIVVAAVLLLSGGDARQKLEQLLEQLKASGMSWRHAVAAGLLAYAVWSLTSQPAVEPPAPPPPPPAPSLDLSGLFQGETAAEDAATIAALCGELADEIAWDGKQQTPYLRTGVAFDELRHRARDLRCRGVSIGARQPAVRDAIAKHLEDAVGVSGGPVDAAKRGNWVRAFREIEEACDNVTR